MSTSKFYISQKDDYSTGFADGSMCTIMDIQGHVARQDFEETENPILNDLLDDLKFFMEDRQDNSLSASYVALASYIGDINVSLGLPKTFYMRNDQELFINEKEMSVCQDIFSKAGVKSLPGYIKYLRRNDTL
jgi:hypothetical protein